MPTKAPTVTVVMAPNRPFKRGMRFDAAAADAAFSNAYVLQDALDTLASGGKVEVELPKGKAFGRGWRYETDDRDAAFGNAYMLQAALDALGGTPDKLKYVLAGDPETEITFTVTAA